MKKFYYCLFSILLLSQTGHLMAQGVAINTDGSSANAAAILDVKSTSQGMLIPRMTTAQKEAISSPVDGLIVYDTDMDCMYYYSTSDNDWHSFVVSGIANEVSIGGSSNFTTIETDGTLEFNGDATVWDDFVVSPSIKNSQNTGPVYKTFLGNIKAYAFEGATTVGEVFFDVQMPHGWKEGTAIYPHVHWAPGDATGGNILWYLEYTWADNTETFSAPTTINSGAVSVGTTAFKHIITPIPASGGIDGSGMIISSVLRCRLYRDPTGSDTYSGDAFALSIDFHYEINTMGSRTASTK